MYYMVSSSQPLMRTFVSVNLSHSFEKWLWFWFSHSYLKEGASHCKGVFGSWIWIIENYFVEIFGSPLHLVFFDGDWKVYCFLTFGYLWWDLYFWKHCFFYRRATSLGRFFRASSTRLFGIACIREFSLASLWSMISSCYFSVAFVLFSWHIKSDMVDVCCTRERAHWPPWENRFT